MDDIQRTTLLTEGMIIGDWWFNKETAMEFITLTTFASVTKSSTIEWPDKTRTWVEIPTLQAVEMSKQIIEKLQSIYKQPLRVNQ